VKELRVETGVQGFSHVSHNERILMLLSEMKSWRTTGLFNSGVMEEIDRAFRWARLIKLLELLGLGPGFRQMSPERRSSRE
jgi:hypothetical protein